MKPRSSFTLPPLTVIFYQENSIDSDGVVYDHTAIVFGNFMDESGFIVPYVYDYNSEVASPKPYHLTSSTQDDIVAIIIDIP